MKIQEMRPGVLHLSKRAVTRTREDFFDFFENDEVLDQPAERSAPLILSELDQPRWSVVSFERRQAGGMSYNQASALMEDLAERGIPGLCVVTDEAAERINR